MKPVATRLVGLSVLAAIVIGVASAPASADVIRWHFSGVIDGSFECLDFEEGCPFRDEQNEYLLQFFPVGTRVDFDLAIDTQDRCSSPDVGDYDIKEFDITINGVTSSGRGILLLNANTVLGCPGVDPFLGMYVFAGFSSIAGEGQTQLVLDEVEMFFGAISGDDLPTVPPSGLFYLEPAFRYRLLGGSMVGSVVPDVPEPSTLVLVLSGLVASAARRRRLFQQGRRCNNRARGPIMNDLAVH
jgi:PEP-CTERM motif